ncbi:MAG: PBSX family phage terminase large subunit, partial [Spirochaetota bacterium]
LLRRRRGAGKSWAFATVLTIMALEKKIRVLCTREIQNSLDDSVWLLLNDMISRLGLEKYFDIFRDEIKSKNGSLFLFEGLRHSPKNIRSIEAIDVCWIEECGTVSNESWDILLPTIRKPNSEIWMSGNRDREDDPFYERFIKNPRPGSIVKKVLFSDNPWCPHVLLDEADYDRVSDPERFQHVWQGDPWLRSDATVFAGKFSVERFDTPAEAVFKCGLDFGFASDPMAVVRCFIGEGNVLYIDSEAVGHGIEIDKMSNMLDAVLPAKKWPIKADSSRPELISYLNSLGYKIEPSRKGAGSIEGGLEYLRSFKRIVIHPRCQHTIDEFKMYSYKTDKITGQVLPIINPRHDHCIDALRYSCEDALRGGTWNYQDHLPKYGLSDLGL